MARRPFRLFMLAGEASGDQYGAALLRALREQPEEWEVAGWGGDAMAAEGMTLLTHCKTLGFMGFWEVLKHLPTIKANLQRAQSDIHTFDPDVIVFVDFPGFNMRLQRALHSRGHRAYRVQWVSPQVWAWHGNRKHALARDCHAVAPLLPFERAILEEAHVSVWDVGHPLIDLLESQTSKTKPRSLPLVLLPGSRAQELKHHLPTMVAAAKLGAQRGAWSLADLRVAGAPGKSLTDYQVATDAGLTVHFGKTHELLKSARFAWVASGTATLEAALLRTPHVIVYKTSGFTYALAKRLAKVGFIGLPNLILNRSWVPELIQSEFTTEGLLRHTQAEQRSWDRGFDDIRSALGGYGAVKRLAERLNAVACDRVSDASPGK
jgi:lipid-A-disaccharide synthase